MAARRRLDTDLVRRDLAESRVVAQRLIAERRVTVNGALAQKSAHLVAPADAVEVVGPPARYVGRGGDKMQGALDMFDLDVNGMRCIDVGSSTGGFTDCLLQSGAVSVVAIDVGRAQLHDRLRRDERVDVREQTDVRSVVAERIGAPFDLVVVDVSFIGLGQVLDQLLAFAGAAGSIIALVKPQFEAGRDEVSRGKGVIRDPVVWSRVLHEVCDRIGAHAAVRQMGVSPITGGAGNVEFLVLFDRRPLPGPDIGAQIEAAVNAAERLVAQS